MDRPLQGFIRKKFISYFSCHIHPFNIRLEEVSHNTSLTGVPVKVGQTLKNHSIFCIKEKILKNSVDILYGLFYQHVKFEDQIIFIFYFTPFDRKYVCGFPETISYIIQCEQIPYLCLVFSVFKVKKRLN